jgi:hypothetical protein
MVFLNFHVRFNWFSFNFYNSLKCVFMLASHSKKNTNISMRLKVRGFGGIDFYILALVCGICVCLRELLGETMNNIQLFREVGPNSSCNFDARLSALSASLSPGSHVTCPGVFGPLPPVSQPIDRFEKG